MQQENPCPGDFDNITTMKEGVLHKVCSFCGAEFPEGQVPEKHSPEIAATLQAAQQEVEQRGARYRRWEHRLRRIINMGHTCHTTNGDTDCGPCNAMYALFPDREPATAEYARAQRAVEEFSALPLTEMLRQHQHGDERERLVLGRALREARADDAFERARPVHFTASALVVDQLGEEVLLVNHRKFELWLQPGGHVEPADVGNLVATALREAREETGCQVELHPSFPRVLDVDMHLIPARPGEPEHHHIDVCFLALAADRHEVYANQQEASGAEWMTWVLAMNQAGTRLPKLLRKAQAALGL